MYFLSIMWAFKGSAAKMWVSPIARASAASDSGVSRSSSNARTMKATCAF